MEAVMSTRFENAELLAALWLLGAEGERLPTSHGILDKALKECMAVLPSALSASLSFGVTGVGLRCYELPDILLAAQEALLTTEPNPTYLSSLVTLDEDSARQIVLSYGLSTSKAREIGESLLASVKRTRAAVKQAAAA
ncbi:hypothetical protein RHEC894_PC00019 (plasmid) [Rhizobium sp. CIAT894]|nr:hypothetical protein RHEC894_PC00019 [Rhizobium sp. CIAT894]